MPSERVFDHMIFNLTVSILPKTKFITYLFKLNKSLNYLGFS